MNFEDELKLRFETFSFFKSNTQNDDAERCKKGSQYFYNEKTSLTTTCSMILKMQQVMFRSLPKQTDEHYTKQFNRMNDIVKDCKETLTNIENEKRGTD
jgi:hypothetical protein